MTADQITEAMRLAEEKISYELQILAEQTGMDVLMAHAARKVEARETAQQNPAHAFEVTFHLKARA